jgi:two-component system response regulator HydG
LIAYASSIAESVKERHLSFDSELSTFFRVTLQEKSVLLTGETGTGKTRLARIIHDLSPRRAAPFLIVDCGSMSLNLIERGSFGQGTGPFHSAMCDLAGNLATIEGGTLLLDEVERLPLSLQDELLHTLDAWDSEFGCSRSPARLIAASSESLEHAVRAGRFRAELCSRLNGVAFRLLPLRQQRSAIGVLGHQLLHAAAARSRADVSGLSPGAVQALERYDWPGNIRELRNVVERAVEYCEERVVSELNLPDIIRYAQAAPRVDEKKAGPAQLLELDREETVPLPIEEVLRRRGEYRFRDGGEND